MAFVLYVMHLYWTYFLMKVGVNSLIKKKMVNDHEKVKDWFGISNFYLIYLFLFSLKK